MSETTPLTPEESASRIAGLVLLNAMIFQEVLASHNSEVRPLAKLIDEANPVQAFCDHWRHIVRDIDYYSIFNVAHEVAADISPDQDAAHQLRSFARAAQRIVTNRTALRHDLMGRIYHRLLVEAKYLGTYYTGIPAAAFLLSLAFRPDGWGVDWSDVDDISSLRIADLACGTGTLLMAAADAVTDNYVAACATQHTQPDIPHLQKSLVESVLLGYDVLPSAIHLTASTLALRVPEVPFEGMNLWSMPLGGSDHRLGSLEFLGEGLVQGRLWGALGKTARVKGKQLETTTTTSVPKLDLCVMNPPFTRSVGGNLLFGSLPESERGPLQDRLRNLVRSEGISASITAGLGSPFVAAANKYVKKGGRMALVLPKALVSGVAWGRTRKLLSEDYVVEYIVSSHDPERWNFSENTSLSEVLVVARRIHANGEAPAEAKAAKQEAEAAHTVAVNLRRNPTSSFESLAVAQQVLEREPPSIEHGQGALNISVGETEAGQAVSVPWADLAEAPMWMLPCAFAQADLIRVAFHLGRRRLWLPGFGRVGKVPLCELSELGTVGPDRRDVYDGFERSSSETQYPAYWGHNAEEATTIAQTPNAHLRPLSQPKKGRPLRQATVLWPRSGRLMVAERLWLNTQRVAAVLLPTRCLANVWWPFALRSGAEVENWAKVLALWLNASVGLVTILSRRQETRGAWVDFKKPVVERLPVIDVTKLEGDKLEHLVHAYESVAHSKLLPLPEIQSDPVRKKIDESIAEALELPDLNALREMLAREPIISLERLG